MQRITLTLCRAALLLLIGSSILSCATRENARMPKEPEIREPDQKQSEPFAVMAVEGGSAAAPTELYSGQNVITFTAPSGIQEIRPMFDPVTASLTKVEGTGKFDGCPDKRQVRITVNTASQPLGVRFTVIDCEGHIRIIVLPNRTWRLDEVPFPDAEVGDTICRPFQIGLQGLGGAEEYLDSISVGHPQAFIRYINGIEPPMKVVVGSTFRYMVCFVPRRPGLYRFPVITWMRRSQPVEGYTNYPVADTAVVRVKGRNLK